jgi:hypothetical protein
VLDERLNEALLVLQLHAVKHAPVGVDADEEFAFGFEIGKIHAT